MNLVDSRQWQRDHSNNPADWHLANEYPLIKALMTRQSPLHYTIVRENVSPRIRRRFDYTPWNPTLSHLVTSNIDPFSEYISLVYHTVTSSLQYALIFSSDFGLLSTTHFTTTWSTLFNHILEKIPICPTTKAITTSLPLHQPLLTVDYLM